MSELKNKLVKLFFKNGLTAEGIVHSWSAGISILNNPVGPGYLIVHDTLQNVMMVRVIMESAPEEKQEPVSWSEPLVDDSPKLPVGHKIVDPNLRFRKLAELRWKTIQEHKKQLAERLQHGAVSGAITPEVNYEYPNFTKLKPVNSSKSKNPRRS